MPNHTSIFRGCIPALMTPCSRDGVPDFDALVTTARSLIADGMRAVVYCGSMGDWCADPPTFRLTPVQRFCGGFLENGDVFVAFG